MKPPSFERSSDNPYIRKPESEEESLDTPKKKDGKKDKDREKTRKHKDRDRGEKKHEDEKKDKKHVEEEDEEHKKKPSKKHGKEKKKDKEDEDLEEERKEKRQALIERSLNYKKLYEEVPIPRDPWIVARLMVAEHILAIHSQIEQPAPDVTPLDELRLLASLDYMGTIANTLENPHAETTPEIKETCDTLVQLAQNTLEEGDENIAKTLVEANSESAQVFEQDGKNEPEVTPSNGGSVSESLPVSGAALLAVLTHVRQQSHQQIPPVNPTAHTAPLSVSSKKVNSGTPPPPTVPTPNPLLRTVVSPTPPTQGDGHAEPPSIHVPRREAPLITPERHVQSPTGSNYSERPNPTEARQARPDYMSAPLATFVVAAALKNPNIPNLPPRINETPTPVSHFSPGAREYTPASPFQNQQSFKHETPRVNSAPKPVYTPEHLPSPTHIQPIPSVETGLPSHLTNRESSSELSHASQKIEHLPLVSLLAMAETVSIGHGQRLRSAYEKGAIDKEGLVKILKSYSKHHDFVQEYRQQVVKHQNLLKSSPEFLTPTQPKRNVDTSSSPVEASTQESAPAIPKDFQPDTNITDFMPTSDLPRPEKQSAPADIFDTPDEKLLHPTWLVPGLIAILILGVGILLGFLILR